MRARAFLRRLHGPSHPARSFTHDFSVHVSFSSMNASRFHDSLPCGRAGWLLAVAYVFAGLSMALTIIFIPFVPQALRLAWWVSI